MCACVQSVCDCALFACMWRGWWKFVANKGDGQIWERRAKWARKSEVSPVSFSMQTPSSLPLSYSLLSSWRGGLQAEQADRSLISKMMVTSPLSLSVSLQPHHVLRRYEPNHSLAEQRHTQHLSPLSSCLSLSLSRRRRRFCRPCSVSSRHLLRPSVSFMPRLWVE